MIRAESASLIIQNWIMRCIQHFTILITFEVNCGNSESINSLATFAYARAFEEKCVEVATAAMRATAGISE